MTKRKRVKLQILEKSKFREFLDDLKAGRRTMSLRVFSFLVRQFYDAQEHRKRTDNQLRGITPEGKGEKPWKTGRTHEMAAAGGDPAILMLVSDGFASIEGDILRILDWYVANDPLGAWCLTQKGVGTRYAANLMANIRFELDKCHNPDCDGRDPKRKKPKKKHKTGCRWCGGQLVREPVMYPSAIWAFCGLDPSKTWGKGEVRPWNARLKTVCHLLGEQWMRLKNNPDCFWGHVFDEYWKAEQAKNREMQFADQATVILEAKPKHKQRAIYAKGMLSDGHIINRAYRKTVKAFLTWYHFVGYCIQFGETPPRLYVHEILGHGDLIEPPGVREYVQPFITPTDKRQRL